MMKLMVFPHSHFCEKALWALDCKGLPYQRDILMPGYHMLQVRRIAPQSSVPVLVNESDVVQGANKIISYLDEKFPEPGLLGFQDPQLMREALELEAHFDHGLGVPLRQIAYAYLLSYPDYCRQCFTGELPWWQQQLFRVMFPQLKKLLFKAYVKSDSAVEKAKVKVLEAFDDLDARVSRQDFLAGSRFSRVDLSVCAMLSLLVQSGQQPFSWPDQPSEELEKLISQFRSRPTFKWAAGIYQEFR